MVINGVIALCFMALRAKQVTLDPETKAVGVMTVGTGNTGPVHAALDERTVDVNFFFDLPIRMIERLFQ